MNVAHDNMILKIIVGSRLYGTNTPESDMDFSGIFIAPKEYYLGMNKIEEADCSTVSKDENGKNTSEAIDFKLYEIRKFVSLAKDNNPTILEQLFVPNECICFEHPIIRQLLNNKHLFPYQGLKDRFIGYAKSQLHKAHIKVDNYDSLHFANEWLFNQQFENAGRLLAEFRNANIKGIKFYEHHATIGDLNISLTDKLSKVYNKVTERISKVGNRKELYTKYGYDPKFLSHCVRLLLEGKELLETGNLIFPLTDRKFLLEIRNGKHKPDDIIAYAESLISQLDTGYYKTELPSKPRFDVINKLLISMIEECWNLN